MSLSVMTPDLKHLKKPLEPCKSKENTIIYDSVFLWLHILLDQKLISLYDLITDQFRSCEGSCDEQGQWRTHQHGRRHRLHRWRWRYGELQGDRHGHRALGRHHHLNRERFQGGRGMRSARSPFLFCHPCYTNLVHCHIVQSRVTSNWSDRIRFDEEGCGSDSRRIAQSSLTAWGMGSSHGYCTARRAIEVVDGVRFGLVSS